MTRLKQRVLCVTGAAVALVAAAVFVARWTGFLSDGQPGPIFAGLTLIISGVTLWAARATPARGARSDRC